MQEPDKVLKILGFANRARKLTLGMTATVSALKRGGLKLIILAEDCSENTQSKIQLHNRHNLQVLEYSNKENLGLFFGRGEVGIIGIQDQDFAKSLKKLILNYTKSP